jgi:predicted alpha/beta-hydrolase family hydrolase
MRRTHPVVWAAAFLATLCAWRAASSADPAGKVETISISTPRGASIEASLHTPAKGNGAAVVLAPGQGYHRALPLLLKTSEALAAAGFVVLRFDWAYTPSKGKPSPDLSAEAEDLEAALAHVRKVEGVTSVVLAGKSLGSAVAFDRALRKADDLAGLLLLTFPVHGPGGQPNPGVERLGDQEVKTAIIQGDADPLGALRALYDVAAKAKSSPRVVVVPGDHSYAEKPDEAKGAENVEAAARATVLWARRFAGV